MLIILVFGIGGEKKEDVIWPFTCSEIYGAKVLLLLLRTADCLLHRKTPRQWSLECFRQIGIEFSCMSILVPM